MATPTLEERVAVLETKLEQLQREKDQKQEQDKKAEEPRGWKRMVGIFADNPEFEEAVRTGKEWRASEDDFNNGNA